MKTTKCCPKCGHSNTFIVDSRTYNNATTRRRRECDKCGYRYNTFEVSEEDFNIIKNYEQIRKNNQKQLFDCIHILSLLITTYQGIDNHLANQLSGIKLKISNLQKI